MARPHIQVILAADKVPDCLRAALQRISATAGFWPLEEALRGNPALGADALVVIVSEDTSTLTGPLRILFDRLAEHPRATLVLTSNGQAVPPFEHPPTLPVTFSDGPDERGLAIRLATMLEMRHSLDALHRGLVANRRSGESMAKRYLSQLRLASQVQREFLPETLPRFGPVAFDVLFRPVDYVSGDIYDVHRLDEEHIGIALADASGHGIPAALLTVYIKRTLRGKEIGHGTYRILPPDEVLLRLNEDILDAHLTECPFVAAVYAVLDTRTLELSLARGGAPYPIHRTARGELHLLDVAGGVVGVLPNARFEVRRIQLQRGDSVLFLSDGLERILGPPSVAREVPAALAQAASRILGWNAAAVASAAGAGHQPVPASASVAVATLPDAGDEAERAPPRAEQTLAKGSFAASLAAGERATDSAWLATLRSQGPEAALEQVAGRQRALRRMGYPLDDLTVLALRIDS